MLQKKRTQVLKDYIKMEEDMLKIQKHIEEERNQKYFISFAAIGWAFVLILAALQALGWV